MYKMIFDKVKAIIVEQLGVDADEVKLESTFEGLGADSLDITQVIMEIEDEFSIEVEEGANIKTIEDAVKYIEEKTK